MHRHTTRKMSLNKRAVLSSLFINSEVLHKCHSQKNTAWIDSLFFLLNCDVKASLILKSPQSIEEWYSTKLIFSFLLENYNPKVIPSILRLNTEYRVCLLPANVVYVKHGALHHYQCETGKVGAFLMICRPWPSQCLYKNITALIIYAGFSF